MSHSQCEKDLLKRLGVDFRARGSPLAGPPESELFDNMSIQEVLHQGSNTSFPRRLLGLKRCLAASNSILCATPIALLIYWSGWADLDV